MKRTLSQREIQDHLFALLAYFADFCEWNQLKYSLCGGTLLGAVRHQDFIPWDDDVDVFMPRPDYERFLDIFPNDKYHLACLEKHTSNYPFAKILNMHVTIREKFLCADHYLWIDIFPVDGMPKDFKKCLRILKQAQWLKGQNTRRFAVVGQGKTALRTIAKIPVVLWCKLHSGTYYGEKADALARQYDFSTNETVASIVWNCGSGEILPRNTFDDLVKVSFHGREFWAISEWDRYLKGMYGDYMQLPPERERKTHNFTAVIEE